jgi:biopolymer transport protein ExbD
MTKWGWSRSRATGASAFAPDWLKALSSAAPWLTAGLLFVMIWMTAGAITTAEGALFDLPSGSLGDVADVAASALVKRTDKGTLVFFDDTRFVLGDEAQTAALAAQMSAKIANRDRPTILALADRRVSAGDLVKFADIAKSAGVNKVLFAERREEARE